MPDINLCPDCGSELSDEPDGTKVFECPEHGVIGVTVIGFNDD